MLAKIFFKKYTEYPSRPGDELFFQFTYNLNEVISKLKTAHLHWKTADAPITCRKLSRLPNVAVYISTSLEAIPIHNRETTLGLTPKAAATCTFRWENSKILQTLDGSCHFHGIFMSSIHANHCSICLCANFSLRIDQNNPRRSFKLFWAVSIGFGLGATGPGPLILS